MKDDPLLNHNSKLIVTALSVVVLGFVDYVTGYKLRFFLFYFVPIAIAAWKVGPTSSYLISLLRSIVSFFSNISSHPYSSVLFAFWNTIMRLFSFLTIAYSMSKIRILLVKERDTSRDRLSRAKTLDGLIPICARCKEIRDDEGDWQRIEEYVEKHKNAQFTLGLYPECLDKLQNEVGIDNLPRPAGQLLGTVSKQIFSTRILFRGQSQRF
jgi:hypothetical protein